MDRAALNAQGRTTLGKKVKTLRKDGLIPGHVFGNQVEPENVTVKARDFLKVFKETGESGLIDLKIGDEKIRPVLVRNFQVDPIKDTPVHVDFYQVNLNKPVQVTVPVVIIGKEPDLVHTGEAVVIQPLNEIEVEALPANLPEHIEVDISSLKQISDSISVSQLTVPEGVTLMADPEGLVVKLDTAVTAEMQEIMAEAEAAAEAAQEAQAPEEGIEAVAEGEVAAEAPSEAETPAESGEESTENKEESV